MKEAKNGLNNRRLIVAMVILIALTIGLGLVLILNPGPEPQIMAPGPHYTYETPLENADGGS